MEGYDTSGEAQSAARRRKMLEAMMVQSRQPLVGRSGPAQAIAQMLTGVLLDRQRGQVDQQDADGRVKYGTELGNETTQYLDRMAGKPGEQMSPQQVDALMNQDQAPQLADPVAPNPREAIVRAITSQKPEMRALGKVGMEEQLRSMAAKRDAKALNPIDILKLGDMSPESRITAALSGDLSSLKGAPKEHVVNGQIIRSSGNGPVEPAGDFRTQYGPDQVVNGAVVQRAAGTNEARPVASAPPVGQVINIDNVGANAAVKEVLPVLKSATESMSQSH